MFSQRMTKVSAYMQTMQISVWIWWTMAGASVTTIPDCNLPCMVQGPRLAQLANKLAPEVMQRAASLDGTM